MYLRQHDGKRRTVYIGRHGSDNARRRGQDACALDATGNPVDTALAHAIAPSWWPLVSASQPSYWSDARPTAATPRGGANVPRPPPIAERTSSCGGGSMPAIPGPAHCSFSCTFAAQHLRR